MDLPGSLEDLDAAATLSAAEAVFDVRRDAEVRELEVACHWADLHASDPRMDPHGGRKWGTYDRLIGIGGDGSPHLREFCLAEYAVSAQVHTLSARHLIADALDLRHRLPHLWAQLLDRRVTVWVARKIAAMTRHLSAAAVATVDLALAPFVATEQPGRLLELTEAKIIEADPALDRARREAERQRRYVSLSRTDPAGLRTVIARVEAGDAIWIDAILDRIADILIQQGDTHPKEQVRATAFALLARPADALALLLSAHHTPPGNSGDDSDTEDGAGNDEPGTDQPGTDQPGTDQPGTGDGSAATDDPEPGDADNEDTDEPEPEPDEPGPAGSRDGITEHTATRLLHLLATIDLARARPRAQMFIHLNEAALGGSLDTIARVEGIGPIPTRQIKDWLGHTRVASTQVIDLRETTGVSGYHHPERLKHQAYLTTPGDVFPHATTTSRKLHDLDHPDPYQPNGPPGQTSTTNTAPLGRYHHRVKTHSPGWTLQQTGPGEYLWRTPHGRYRYVDHTGTHVISPTLADALAGTSICERQLALFLIHGRAS